MMPASQYWYVLDRPTLVLFLTGTQQQSGFAKNFVSKLLRCGIVS